jgi:hypothetical protein
MGLDVNGWLGMGKTGSWAIAAGCPRARNSMRKRDFVFISKENHMAENREKRSGIAEGIGK